MKNIVILAFEGAQVLDITGPMEVFYIGDQLTNKPTYRIECLGVPQSKVRMSNGLALSTTAYQNWRGGIDTIIVPGASEDVLLKLREQSDFIRWLKTRLRNARRVVSVCTGAFVLAELGYLNGRKASTHWGACDRLQEFSPSTQVDADAIYTKDGNVYTSAGITTGIDLALSLVEEDLGKEISLAVARQLVLYRHRSGGQSQFSVPLALQSAKESRLDKILEHIRRNPQANLRLDAIAGRFSMTPRHLSRLFSAELGVSPAKFVAQQRLQTAKQFLESTQLDIGVIASKCGYTSQGTMSKAFRKQFGVGPTDHRARFS